MLYSRTKLLEIFDIFAIGQRVDQINLARKKFMLDFAIGIILSKNVQVQGFRLHLAAKLIGYEVDKEDRYLLILTNACVDKAIHLYRSRWSIEVFFQSIKKRGFNLENTHMIDLERLKKLFALVSLAFCTCLKAGTYKHQKIKPLRKKKNGYKPNSFFRYGLDYIRKALLHFQYFEKIILDFFEDLIYELHENSLMWANLNFILKL